jgi:hypothetical protein
MTGYDIIGDVHGHAFELRGLIGARRRHTGRASGRSARSVSYFVLNK